MSYVITRSPRGKGEQVEAPAKPDGSNWAFSMCYSGGWRWAWADSVQTLVGVLTGDPIGYEAAGPQEQLQRRLRLMMRSMTIAQATINYLAQVDGRWDRLTDVERGVLMAPTHEVQHGWSRDLLGADYWTAEVPLLVLDTQYAPWSDIPPPSGDPDRLVVLSGLDEESVLDSLMDVGAVRLFVLGEQPW